MRRLLFSETVMRSTKPRPSMENEIRVYIYIHTRLEDVGKRVKRS